MYLFSRAVRLGSGNPEKQLAWALKITEKVNQISEVPVSLWTTVFSPSTNRLAWTAIIEDLVTLETAENKLIADSGYLSLVEEGAAHASGDPVDDGLLQFVFADPKATEIEAQYAFTVQATVAPGCMVRGMELGVETAQRVGQITGAPSSFAIAATGPYGAVEFISVYTSIEELQRGQETIAADAGFNQNVDKELSKVYLPGAVQTAFRRIV